MAVINTRWRVFETFNIWRNHLQASPYDGVATGMTAYFGKIGFTAFSFILYITARRRKDNSIFSISSPLQYQQLHLEACGGWTQVMQKLSKNHRTPWCSLSRWRKLMPFDFYENQECVPRRWFALFFKTHFTAFTHRTTAWGWWLNTLLRVSQTFFMHLFTPGEHQ